REAVQEIAREVSEQIEKEVGVENMAMQSDKEKPGKPSVYGCPECGGVLWELHDGEMLRFRCRVGHSYTAEGLVSAQSEQLDVALWSAFRALEENASLSRRLAERAKQGNHKSLVKRFEQRAQDATEQAAAVRRLLQSGDMSEPVDKTKMTD